MRKRFWISVAVLVLGFLLPVRGLRALENPGIIVSAAISLKDAFQEISAVYKEQSGIEVRLNLGGSGLLQKQIEAGAPVDVYASAGMKQMDELSSAGLIVDATRCNFTRNRLVMIIPSDSALNLHSFHELVRPEVSRLSIGNPKTVPAGQYAEQVLKNLKIWDRLQSRLVPAENVRQVLDYVSRGEVNAGIVYASDVPISHGKTVVVASAPEDSHDPILYPIAVIKGTELEKESRAFIDFVLSSSGQAIMGKYGFLPLR